LVWVFKVNQFTLLNKYHENKNLHDPIGVEKTNGEVKIMHKVIAAVDILQRIVELVCDAGGEYRTQMNEQMSSECGSACRIMAG
jgi:hypothetical protein